MNNWRFLRGLKIAAFVVVGIFLLGFVARSLWNNLIPILFNGPVINIGQAIGLLILGRLFFGNFGGRRGGCGHCGQGFRGHWRKRFEEKLSSMSSEERERLKQKMNQKCGPWFGNFENPKDSTVEQ